MLNSNSNVLSRKQKRVQFFLLLYSLQHTQKEIEKKKKKKAIA